MPYGTKGWKRAPSVFRRPLPNKRHSPSRRLTWRCCWTVWIWPACAGRSAIAEARKPARNGTGYFSKSFFSYAELLRAAQVLKGMSTDALSFDANALPEDPALLKQFALQLLVQRQRAGLVERPQMLRQRNQFPLLRNPKKPSRGAFWCSRCHRNITNAIPITEFRHRSWCISLCRNGKNGATKNNGIDGAWHRQATGTILDPYWSDQKRSDRKHKG